MKKKSWVLFMIQVKQFKFKKTKQNIVNFYTFLNRKNLATEN